MRVVVNLDEFQHNEWTCPEKRNMEEQIESIRSSNAQLTDQIQMFASDIRRVVDKYNSVITISEQQYTNICELFANGRFFRCATSSNVNARIESIASGARKPTISRPLSTWNFEDVTKIVRGE